VTRALAERRRVDAAAPTSFRSCSAKLGVARQGNGRDGREAIPIHAQSRKKTAPPVSNRKGGP